MKIRTLVAVLMTLTVAGAGPAFAQGQANTPVTPKNRVTGPFDWQQPAITPKHRLTGAYTWQQTTPPPQDPKPEAKVEMKVPTPSSLADKWTVSIDANGQTMEAALDLKADAKEPTKKVAGSITGPQGESVIEGEVVAGKLTFWFTMNGGGGEMSITFAGTVQKDGSLAGTLNFGQGDMNWTAVRVKK